MFSWLFLHISFQRTLLQTRIKMWIKWSAFPKAWCDGWNSVLLFFPRPVWLSLRVPYAANSCNYSVYLLFWANLLLFCYLYTFESDTFAFFMFILSMTLTYILPCDSFASNSGITFLLPICHCIGASELIFLQKKNNKLCMWFVLIYRVVIFTIERIS